VDCGAADLYLDGNGAHARKREIGPLPPRDASVIARRCERAVVNAYRELRAHGVGDVRAFNACATLYRIHHPEAQAEEARRLAAEWIDHHVINGDTGPTPGCDCG
jgi:hypothetical protein